jgi:hypothetical protein
MTRKDVAKQMGLSIAQVRRAEESGLRKLKLALESRGITRETIIEAFKEVAHIPLPRIDEKAWSEDEETEATEEETGE